MKVLIMAGGSGVRFWPLSTKEKPKQLLSLVSKKSMIRETVDRILNLVSISDVFIATNEIQVSGIIGEIPELPIDNIIVEPMFRDTAAAIVYGSTYISLRSESNPTIIVLAADHIIEDVHNFTSVLEKAGKVASEGYIATLGVNPSRPETGYGYIKLVDKEIGRPSKVLEFMEKPELMIAEEYIREGNYVWNSGMFVFKHKILISEMEKYIPNHVDVVHGMIPLMRKKSGQELSVSVKKDFELFERISIDFAVMEKSNNIICIPVDFGWNDVGGYNSLQEMYDSDSCDNVVVKGMYSYVDSFNNIVISDRDSKLITSVGVSNCVIVNTEKAMLVCDREKTSMIKELLKKI